MTDDLKTWDAWHNIHQRFELDWWKERLPKGHYGDDAAFAAFVKPLTDWIKPRGTIIDIGCGPRPFWRPCVAIEPLAEEYRGLVPGAWWEGVTAYAQPAEEPIWQLMAGGDTIVCWNALDHAVGWRQILDRIQEYARPKARIAIATDFWPPFVGHPGYPREEFMTEIEARFTILQRKDKGDDPFSRELSLLMTVL